MYRSRIIPVLLLKDDYVVKTINFKNSAYIGDPINIVRLFNDKEADELVIFDIEATINKKINYNLIDRIATNARMPLCYGGGIKDVQAAERIFSIGIEKVAIGKELYFNDKLIKEISSTFGSQSCVATLNIDMDSNNNYFINNENNILYESEICHLLKRLVVLGVGEIIINCIHKDGTQDGYDEKLVGLIYRNINLPFTFVGGAESLSNIRDMGEKYPMIAFGVGSLFIYKGKKRAVLISYHDRARK
jgi:imidazole glycerol-phosphate synthase subunit HisF